MAGENENRTAAEELQSRVHGEPERSIIRAKQKVREAKDKLGDKVEHAADKAADMTKSAADRARNAVKGANER